MFETYLLKKVRSEGKKILESINNKQSLSEDLEQELKSFLNQTIKNFQEENNAKS